MMAAKETNVVTMVTMALRLISTLLARSRCIATACSAFSMSARDLFMSELSLS